MYYMPAVVLALYSLGALLSWSSRRRAHGLSPPFFLWGYKEGKDAAASLSLVVKQGSRTGCLSTGRRRS